MKLHLPFIFFISAQVSLAQSFTKISTEPLSNTPGDSRSVNWIDVNNDNFIDCMITNGPSGGQNNSLYLNNGSGNFVAVSGDSIVLDNKPSDGATWADTDNDGDLDCFVVNWYGQDNLFYTNDGAGIFTGIHSANLVNDGGHSETASWGDYNNDGLVDLYVTNSAGAKKNFLYKNLGANTFTKITQGALVNDAYESRSVNWTDMDLDGDLDLFVSNENNTNENIYRNDGDGSFTRIMTGALVSNAGNTMSSSWGDFDNDGDMDVFLANDQGINALFRNDGNFNFTKMASDTISKTYGRSFSSAWSDVDNDGDIDLFVTNSFNTPTKLVNYFYLNNGIGIFTRVSSDIIASDSAWSYGCAFGDYDNDGFEDLAVATCRFNGVDAPDLLYHNNGNSNSWITIKLTGTASNRSAIGAKVRLKTTINGNTIWQMREVTAQSGYCSQNDLRVHFGLGYNGTADSVKIEWPSGVIQYSANLAPNQFVNIIEGGSPNALQENKNIKQKLKLFPNPSAGFVYIEKEQGFNTGDKIIVTDVSGRQLLEVAIPSFTKQFKLDLKKYNISNGTYMATLLTPSEKTSQLFIISN